MSEHEPHVPTDPPTPGAQPGPDPTAPQPPDAPPPPAAPDGPPPGSPLAPPPGAPAPPAPNSPDAPAPGPIQPPAYPPAGYPQQQPGYQQQPPAYPQQQQGYLQQAPGYSQQPGYPQQAPMAYAPGPTVPRRPPLGPRQKRGAMIAGAVSFTLMSLGFALVMIPLAIAAFGAFFGALFGWIASRNPEDFSQDGLTGPDVIEQFVRDAWSMAAPWFIGMVILGVIIWVLGYLSSIWILRGHAVNRPVAVTWSGLGIAIVANGFISGITSPLLNLGNMFTPTANVPEGLGDPGGLDSLSDFDFTPLITVAAVGGIVSLIVSALIGLLSWWWMAHAFRERPTGDTSMQAPPLP